MRPVRMGRWTLGGLAILVVSGCQQTTGDIFYRAGRSHVHVASPRPYVELAAHSESASESGPTTLPVATVPRPTSGPTPSALYTAPGAGTRQLSYATLVGASAVASSIVAGAKEASESSLAGLQGAGGYPGVLSGVGIPQLGAPQPLTMNAVVGQAGLQRGLAAGLGFVRVNNLLAPRANPMTGANGQCGVLVRAGLFPNQTACRRYFGK